MIRILNDCSVLLVGIVALLPAVAGNGSESRIEIDLSKRGAEIPSSLYGIFFEEITGSGDGGLYAEMIRNRGFEEGVLPTGCTLDAEGYAAAPMRIAIRTTQSTASVCGGAPTWQ